MFFASTGVCDAVGLLASGQQLAYHLHHNPHEFSLLMRSNQ
jgi:hypothetical protein